MLVPGTWAKHLSTVLLKKAMKSIVIVLQPDVSSLSCWFFFFLSLQVLMGLMSPV